MTEPANAQMPNARLLAWRRFAEERLTNAHRRTVFCLIAGAIVTALFGSIAALAWCGLVGASYLVDARVWRFALSPRCTRPSVLMDGWIFLQSLIACGLGPILWFSGEPSGKILAVYFLAAGIFNALVTCKNQSRILLVALSAPFGLLAAMPMIDFAMGVPSGRDLTLLLPLLGVVVLGFFCFSLWCGLSVGEETRIVEQSAAIAVRAQAEEQAAGHERLLGMVERELRAPLQALMAATAKLMQSGAPEAAKRPLRAVHDAGEVLSMVVSDLSALATLQAGGLRTSTARVEPRQLAAAVADAWRDQAQAKWLELFVDVNPATPEAVALDAKRVSQVLHQLLANAVRFTRQGGVRLQVDAAPGRDGQGLWIAFSVSDTGPGIDPERLAEALAPGDRVARAAARGYGLGTAISACVAEALGGRLTARSVAGQGTAFSLVVPTRALGHGEQPESEAHAQKRAQKPLSILVVDDHAATRRLASVFLAETAAKVTTASNGQHALEVWAKEPFDVVLTDVIMPGMDGFALASAIRAQGEAGARVPIVAFSAEGALWDTARAQAAGLDGFVSKPFTPSSLFREIERAVALRRVA